MELGATLKPCFDVRRSQVPCNHINIKFRAADFRDTSVAEAGTLQLELRDLSRTSKISFYEVRLYVSVNVSLLLCHSFYAKL